MAEILYDVPVPVKTSSKRDYMIALAGFLNDRSRRVMEARFGSTVEASRAVPSMRQLIDRHRIKDVSIVRRYEAVYAVREERQA